MLCEVDMLSLETIKKETLWVAKMNGFREIGTYDALKSYRESDECRDFDTICSQGQPEHLRQFWKDYEEQDDLPYEDRLFLIDDFYAKWVKEQK